jgi:hypothetical protein
MATAMKVWRFCVGWNPERVPIAAALYGVDDLETLYGDLLVIDNAIKSHEEAQRKAQAMKRGG